MADNNEILDRIKDHMGSLSKGQKKIASYVTDNYDTAAFMTAAKLGKITGVSESTVVRFASLLGYDGYPEFQSKLEEMVKGRLNSIERIEIAAGSMEQAKVLENVLKADADKINLTLENIDRNAFDMAVDSLLSAQDIYVVGVRSCAPLAEFLCFYLNMMFKNVHKVTTTSSSEMFEQMIRVGAEDVVIGISFPRYSLRTLKAMEFANNRNAKVITITDSKHSPMNLYSSCNLFARSDMASIVDSLVAPLSLINALIVSLCLKKQDDVLSNLQTLEDVWDNYQVYNNDEINFLDDEVVDELKRLGGTDE